MTVDSPQPTVQRLPGPSNPASPDGSSVPPAPRSGGAKVRILETASQLFYAEGIHSVGVDRLISAASVTKATFYKHYGSKDNLILAYIREQDTRVQQAFTTLVEQAPSPVEAVRAWVAAVSDDVGRADFRGCAFLNAAAEYHDPAIRSARWSLRTVTGTPTSCSGSCSAPATRCRATARTSSCSRATA